MIFRSPVFPDPARDSMDPEGPGIENHRLSIEILLKTIDLGRRAGSGEAGDRNPLEIL